MSSQAEFSPEHYIAELATRGIELYLDGNELGFRARKGSLDEETRQRIRSHRDAIVGLLQRNGSSARLRPSGSIGRSAATSRFPLSFVQKRLWFLNQLEPGSPEYNIGRVLRIREAIDLEILSASVDDLLARHSIFRSRFFADNGEPIVEILPAAPIKLEQNDRTSVASADVEEVLREECCQAIRSSFQLEAGLTALIRVVRLAPSDHLLLIVVHHIVADGMSVPIIIRDLTELYAARIEGRPSRLPALPLEYSDYAIWEEQWASGPEAVADKAYWRDTLDGAPALLELPSDRPRPLVSTGRGRRLAADVAPPLVTRLNEIARGHGATLFMALVAVWQTLLGRLAGQSEIVVGTPISTREDIALKNVVGCFINNIALRGDLAGQPTFVELLERTRKTVLSAFSHSTYPFNMVVEALDPPRSANHSPIFQTLFTFMNFHDNTGPAASNISQTLSFDTGRARFDLSLELTQLDVSADEGAGGLEASYEYDTDLFDEARIARMHGQFVSLLEAAAERPDASLDLVPLLPAVEAEALSAGSNVDAPAVGLHRSVHVQVAAIAASMSKAIALRTSAEVLDFAAFEARANRLAHALAARGIGAGDRVAVGLGRTAELPIALAAIAKTGAAYVPCDPSHPAERIGYVLRDADVASVITRSEHTDLFETAPLLLLDDDADAIAAQSSAPLDRPSRPDDIAYLMYTSGSTGRPKGVAVTHANLTSFLDTMRASPGLAAGEAVLAVTTPTFDISVLELWLPLTTGGQIVLAGEDEVVSGEALAELVAAHDVRLLQATPTTWRLLLDAGWTGKPDLKALCGGEAITVELAPALLGRVAELWNLYGPTETTIWSTTHRVSKADIDIGRIPVGRPIAGTRVYVMEPSARWRRRERRGSFGSPAPALPSGYWNLPELTASVFVGAIHSRTPGAALPHRRSGSLACRRRHRVSRPQRRTR